MNALYVLEQELARRCGPLFIDQAASGTTMTVTVTSLQSTLALGDQWTGQYLLRRGLLNNTGQPLAGFIASDRVRRVAAPVNNATGAISVDRPWAVAPVVNETIELHYLDPIQELRPSLLAGLERCFVVDRPSVVTTGIAAERDITAIVPWITQLGQIYEIGWVFPGVFYIERPVPFWRELSQNGHIWVQIMPDPFPNNLLITARRPVDNFASVTPPQASVLTWTVTDALSGTPCVLSIPGHPFTTGDLVTPTLVNCGNLINGIAWTVTVIDSLQISLNGSAPFNMAPLASTYGTVTSAYGSTRPSAVVTLVNALVGPIVVTAPHHPFVTGRLVDIAMTDPIQQLALGGTWTVTVIDANSFSLNGSAASNIVFSQTAASIGTATLDPNQGPVADTDLLPVEEDYAAAAGHVAAWLRFPDRLIGAAQIGLKATQAMAAAEMTRQAALNFHPPAKRSQLAQPFPTWQTARP